MLDSANQSSENLGPRFPRVGEEIFNFRLRRELGHGAFARVFLAEQPDLAGRPVVLKVSGIDGNEPQTLAQLQHTHIVPIHSVHENPQTGLRAVCMPYFGGASLSQVLGLLWKEGPPPTEGRQFVNALETAQAPPPGTEPGPSLPMAAGRAVLDLLAGSTYLRATAWLVARLAEALQHAHDRGVYHRDIKPSNILIGGDGQPLLLDFNLSRSLHGLQAQANAVLGGTVTYMSPEHLRALAARDPELDRRVDHRSDIYSLGMVLYHMLVGQLPFEHRGSYSVLPVLIELMATERSRTVPSARAKRSDMPWGLESIVRKCLAPDPALRYQRAEDLAEDLHRFLKDQPLRVAPELSRVERVRKWARRHPRLTSSGSVAVVAGVLLVAACGSAFVVRDHLIQAEEQLAASQAEDRRREFEAGALRATCLVNTTVDMQDNLAEGRAACEATLALYDVLGREDWQAHPAWQRLNPDDRKRLSEDVRELLMLLAWARVRPAPEDPAVLRDAVNLLDRAAAVEGLPPSRALLEDRAVYLTRLRDQAGAEAARARAKQLETATARDHYLLAISYARAGKYAPAVAELDEALRLNPRHYWSRFQRGLCHQELGKHTLAVSDFATCVGLWPDFAPGYFNRGYALDQAGNKGEAVQDYTVALARDSDYRPALFNRGTACLELRRFDQALADFTKVAALGRDDAVLHAGRGVALEGLGRSTDADAAFAAAFDRLPQAAAESRVRIRWVYGFAVSARLPAKAREAFDDVLRHHPDQPQALYGRALLLLQAGGREAALPDLDRAVDAAPAFLEARRARAILLARLGKLEAASQDVNQCLERDPGSGSMLYAAACVASQAATHTSDPAARQLAVNQALQFLQKALAQGYGHDRAATDPDLEGLRSHPDFGEAVRTALAARPGPEDRRQ
jgi:serine/threonine protein kinase/tetratricopeptide (TPR) repeat protein